MRGWVMVLVLAGCSAPPEPWDVPRPPPPPATLTPAAPPPLAPFPEPSHPPPPPLVLRPPTPAPPAAPPQPDVWDTPPYGHAEFAVLPAVSSDGKRVALLAIRSLAPGMSDASAVSFELIDPASDRLEKRVILVPGENHFDDATLAARLSEARALLAPHRWTALEAYPTVDDPSAPPDPWGNRGKMAEGEGLVVQYHEPVLTVRETGGRLVAKHKLAAWRVSSSFLVSKDDQRCGFGGLDQVFGDRSAGIVVLVRRFGGGNDSCVEPPETYHALRIPKKR